MITDTVKTFVKEINQDQNGVYSSSHVWFHLINIAMTVAYLFIVYKACLLPIIPIEGLTFLTLVVSGLITGNKLAMKFMNMKFGSTQKEEPSNDNK